MEKKKTKTIYIKYVIDQCKKCPFYDNGYYESSVGFCAKKGTYVSGNTISETCPLKDGQYYN